MRFGVVSRANLTGCRVFVNIVAGRAGDAAGNREFVRFLEIS